jgi:hypothetical protein
MTWTNDKRVWALVKNAATARAMAREVAGVGIELRYYWNDELRQSKVYRNSVELAEAASTKREELLAAGWIDQPPPMWGN